MSRSSDIRIRGAVAADLEAVRLLLLRAGLPVDDLRGDLLAFVAEAEERVVAAIGIETFEATGLLRSLVVDAEFRGGGLGHILVERLEAFARSGGLASLWLLTIDADGWFAQRGYRSAERSAAPEEIRATAEFSSLCPDDAVVMWKRL